jgi:DNA invertase Pin-like site-specific DNA recombinase
MQIGYARISAADQAADLASQQTRLSSFGVDRILVEQAPASLPKCPVLKSCLRSLRTSDRLVVTTPDRLAGSVTELLAINDDLEKRGAGLIVLSMSALALDSRFPDNKLTLAVFTAVADWERAIMLERRAGGLAREGRSYGRPRSIDPHDIEALMGTMSVPKIAQTLKISRSSVYRVLQQRLPDSA